MTTLEAKSEGRTIEQVLDGLRAAKTEEDVANTIAKMPRMNFSMWRAYSRELNAAMERVRGR